MKRPLLFKLSLLLLFLLVLSALFAPWLAPFDPNEALYGKEKTPPSWSHWMGTDELGRDIFSRVLFGARVSLSVGGSATLIALFIGTLMGLLAGFFRGKVDFIVQMLIDLTLAFPMLLLAIGIAIVLPPGLFSITLTLSIVGWAYFARIVRGMVLELREREFVAAAQSLGTPAWLILAKHLLPNLGSILFVSAAIKIGGFILNEAALSFLGLGADPSTPTWGGMVYQGLDFIRYQPWIVFFPGLAISLCVAAFNILGEHLEK